MTAPMITSSPAPLKVDSTVSAFTYKSVNFKATARSEPSTQTACQDKDNHSNSQQEN
jgi:hypothetical protein